RRDHLVAGRDAERAERQLDRGEAGAHAYRVARADERGVFGLEALHFRAKNEIAAVEQRPNGALDLVPNGRMLGAEIDERHMHRRNHFRTPSPRYTTGRMMLHQSITGRIFVYPAAGGG